GGNQVAGAGAGADLARLLPRFRRADVALPERPGAALLGPHLVNGTAGGAVVKHAVAVELLAQRAAAMGEAGAQAAHFRRVLAADGCAGGDLLVVPPDEARRAVAAVTALRTAKS